MEVSDLASWAWGTPGSGRQPCRRESRSTVGEFQESPHAEELCSCLGLPWKALVVQKGRTEHLFSFNVMKTHTFLFSSLFSRVSKDKVSEVLLPRIKALLFYLLTDLVQVISPLNFTVSPPISYLPNWDV